MINKTSTDSRILGHLRADGDTGAVRLEDRYATDITDLWSALTVPERLARWVADVEGDLTLGGRFRARFTSGWEGEGRVDECRPPHRFLVTLAPGDPDETVIEAQLTRVGAETRLVVEERGLPLDELAAHGAGWQVHVEDLAAHLAGREATDWRGRWTELTPLYRAARPAIP